MLWGAYTGVSAGAVGTYIHTYIHTYMISMCMGRYSHFDDADNDCVLFRDEDYLPPAEEEDITGMDSLEEIETMMNKKCPRCSKVHTYIRRYIHTYVCT